MSARAVIFGLGATAVAACGSGAGQDTRTGSESLSANEMTLISTAGLMKQTCDRLVPAQRQVTAGVYAQWRRTHRTTVRQVEASDAYRAHLRTLDSMTAAGITNRDREEAHDYCTRQLPEVLAEQGRPPNPMFASPESTWRAFLAALTSADRTRALSCLASPALAEHGAKLERASNEELRRLAATFVTVEGGDSLGSTRIVKARRADASLHSVFLQRELNGDWKIAAM